MELNLKGKKAIVTGSSSGIGEGIAKCLAKEGVQVMLHGRKKQELERVVKEITDTGGVAYYVEGELINDNDVKRIAEFTLQTFKQVDILINNAGAFPERKWLESKPQDWLDLFNANVVGMVRMIQAFLPQMLPLKWGRIIQIASVAGTSPAPNLPEYGVTKAANINMTISLARELKGSGITVNSVSPGPIKTSGTEVMFKKMAAENQWKNDWEEIEKSHSREIS